MLEQKVDIFIMAGKRKQLSNDIKNVIVEMRKSGHKLQEIANTLNIPRGTVSDAFCPNIADDRFISGLILKIEGLKIHCHKIDVYLFPRMKCNSVIYCDTRYA
jgi:hypothetical protein